MSRSKWKGPCLGENSLRDSKKSYFKTTIPRNSIIRQKYVDQTFHIHNGKKLNEVLITKEMLGHKFGEFSQTRKRFIFKTKKKQTKWDKK